MGCQANFAQVSSLMLFMDNMRCIADLIFAGICHRFPTLRSYRSRAAWAGSPASLEAFDWQWRNGGINVEHPEYDLLPSSTSAARSTGVSGSNGPARASRSQQFPDNVLYETDYPHPTCQHPGPLTPAVRPSDYAESALSGLSDDVLRKIMHDNAATLYGVKG